MRNFTLSSQTVHLKVHEMSYYMFLIKSNILDMSYFRYNRSATTGRSQSHKTS